MVAITEGGYDLAGLATSLRASIGALAGETSSDRRLKGRTSRRRDDRGSRAGSRESGSYNRIESTPKGQARLSAYRRSLELDKLHVGSQFSRASMADYHPQELDKKWQERWAASRAFEVTEDPSQPKFYCLEMFAYPSGHAHVGHVRNYIIGDVMARTKRMRGYNVLHPFGWDAFGLPAENAAIKSGIHPEDSTRANIAHMKGQLQRLGISYAWERELATCDPEYYKWNQWLFIRMFERGLAYRRQVVGELVPEGQHRARQRAGRRRRLLALRHAGRNARSRAVVLPHHRLCRRAARRHGGADEVAREGSDDAAELDRAVGRRAREVPARGRTGSPNPATRIRTHRSLHDAHRHDLRRDVRAARPRASAGRTLRRAVHAIRRRSGSRRRRSGRRTAPRG